MSVSRSLDTFRSRSRMTDGGQTTRARQVSLPVVGQIGPLKAAAAGGVLLLLLLVAMRGGGNGNSNGAPRVSIN